MAVQTADAALSQARNERNQKQRDLEDYKAKLPGLINELFAQVIGKNISQSALSDLSAKESILRAKVEDFEAVLKIADKRVLECKEELETRKAEAQQQTRKLQALNELLKKLEEAEQAAQIKSESKLLDELSASAFVRGR